ncbi:MAG: hypothetical protein KIT74_03285 [Fimbriimonadales bacterium]|nr:hypothetical protein [Fimbriimonadales bacterium]
MKINVHTSLRAVAFLSGTQMRQAGYCVIRTGGSAATSYAPNHDQSIDLDFMIEFAESSSKGSVVLNSHGYRVENSIFFDESDPYTVGFVRGPIMIGEDEVRACNTLRERNCQLNVLTPTDCVRDRLAPFTFYRDRSSLQQAPWVANEQWDSMDLEAIERWCRREGEKERFEQFAQWLNPTP